MLWSLIVFQIRFAPSQRNQRPIMPYSRLVRYLNPLICSNILHVKSDASRHSVRSDGALQVQRKKKNALQKARNGMLARVS